MPPTEADLVVILVVAGFGTDEVALRAGLKHLLPIRFAFERGVLAHLVATVETELASPGFRRELLTDAESCFLFAHVRARIEFVADVSELRQVRVRAIDRSRIIG